MEEFYNQLQEVINKEDKKDVLIIQGDWSDKVGTGALMDWKNYCGPSCNAASNERGLRLLEFISYKNMVLANTLGEHKASRRLTGHAPRGTHHQSDYIMVLNRFRSEICTAYTWIFPRADVGSDHDLVILNFRVRLKKIKKHMISRLKFNQDRLKDSSIYKCFQTTVGGKFTELLTIDDGA